jgi:hypothetical protein
MKTIKTKRVFVWAMYDNLRRIPPKEYPTTQEIKSTLLDVMPVLKEQVPEYIEMMKEAEKISQTVGAKKLGEEEAKAAVEAINTKWKTYSEGPGIEMVELKLNEDGFKTLDDQFNRDGWGKQWIVNIEEFGELLSAFEEAKK